MTVYCTRCHAPLTGDSRCPACGAPGAADPGSLIEKYSRQIEASRRAWAAPPETSAAPLPAFAVAGSATLDGDGLEYQRAPAPAPPPVPAPALAARSPGVLNLLLLHAGYSPWTRLTFEGGEPPPGPPAELRVRARPAAFLETALPVAGGGDLELPVPAPDYDVFFGLDEAVRGELEAEVARGGRILARRTVAVTVQTANEWIRGAGCEAALAGAVTPNAPAVAELVAGLGRDFLGYQSPERGRVEGELASLYEALRGLDLRYLGAPPSYESSGQKVIFPDQVLASRQGCCLDLTVLQAALLERLGYHPLIVLLRDAERRWGHACCGVWTSDVRARSPVLDDRRVVAEAVADGDLLVWNSTQPFERSGDGDFASALAEGERLLAHFEAAVDVAACRAHRYKPMPRRER